jgi:hypothetical protein
MHSRSIREYEAVTKKKKKNYADNQSNAVRSPLRVPSYPLYVSLPSSLFFFFSPSTHDITAGFCFPLSSMTKCNYAAASGVLRSDSCILKGIRRGKRVLCRFQVKEISVSVVAAL